MISEVPVVLAVLVILVILAMGGEGGGGVDCSKFGFVCLSRDARGLH